MGWTTYGANVGEMATGMSAITATGLWVRARVRDWKDAKLARELRNWNGIILPEGIATWFVKLDPDQGDSGDLALVTLEVLTPEGNPDPLMAEYLKSTVASYGQISQSPSLKQWQFLKDLRKKRFGMPDTYPIS